MQLVERKLVAETAELVDPLWRGCDVRDGEVRWRASIESLDGELRWRVAMESCDGDLRWRYFTPALLSAVAIARWRRAIQFCLSPVEWK